MPDVREVYETVTKQKPPEPGALERQQRRQVRSARNKRLGAFAIAAVIGAAAIALVLINTPGADRTTTEPAIRPSPTPPAGTVPETDYLIDLDTGEKTPLPTTIVGTRTSGSGDEVRSGYAVSPDGSRLAYVGSDHGVSVQQIFVANLDGTGVEQVTTVPRALGAEAPAWSPDGSRIAYVSSPGLDLGNIFVLDLAAGGYRQLTFHTGSTGATPRSPSFSPDGSSIVYSVSTWVGSCCAPLGSHVRIVPVTGGKSARLVDSESDGEGLGAADGKLSPDGSLLSYLCDEEGDGQLLCLAKSDGSHARVLVRGNDYLVSHSWSPDGTRIAYWELHSHDVIVVDVATGDVTHVAEGAYPAWLDDDTLIVRIDGCYDHALAARSAGCSG
jgi:Tol biopolymer transport system component